MLLKDLLKAAGVGKFSLTLIRCISCSASAAFWANSVASSSAICAFSANRSAVSSKRNWEQRPHALHICIICFIWCPCWLTALDGKRSELYTTAALLIMWGIWIILYRFNFCCFTHFHTICNTSQKLLHKHIYVICITRNCVTRSVKHIFQNKSTFGKESERNYLREQEKENIDLARIWNSLIKNNKTSASQSSARRLFELELRWAWRVNYKEKCIYQVYSYLYQFKSWISFVCKSQNTLRVCTKH